MHRTPRGMERVRRQRGEPEIFRDEGGRAYWPNTLPILRSEVESDPTLRALVERRGLKVREGRG